MLSVACGCTSAEVSRDGLAAGGDQAAKEDTSVELQLLADEVWSTITKLAKKAPRGDVALAYLGTRST